MLDWYRQRKMDWLERCGLATHEEWPLFGLQKVESQSGQVWVHLTSLPPVEGHRDGVRRLLGEMRRLEHRLEKEGIAGWLQTIRKGNHQMRQWTEMIGATLYAETNERWFFRKEADHAGLPRTLKELVTRYGGHHHGSA